MNYLIFAPMLLILIPFAIGLIIFFSLIAKLASNASKDEWQGEVVDKLYHQKDEDDHKVSHFYTLIIKTTKGEQRKIPVMSDVYSRASVGDKYIKIKGQLNPKKVN